jgi:hypothetical protein
MEKDNRKKADVHPEIKKYLAEIPESLWYIFLPTDSAELSKLAAAIKALRIKEKERDYIIELRRKYKLPFLPNASTDETIKRVRLIRWKQKKENEKNTDLFGGNTRGGATIDPDEDLV